MQAIRWNRWGVAFVLYSATATSITAALFARSIALPDGRSPTFVQALAWQAPIYFAWAALVPVILWVGRRWRLRHESWFAPLPAYAAAGIPIIVGHAVFTAAITTLIGPAADADSLVSSNLMAVVLERIPINILIYWAIVAVAYAGEYYSRYYEGKTQSALLQAELVAAQLEALKMQLHPHYIFNSLQTIAFLIDKDPEAAAEMTVRLGDVLRTTLNRARSQLVPLRMELDLIRDYLWIEEMRLRDRLRVKYEVDPEVLECLVPDLLLQPIVENAIRHGIAPKSDGGRLLIQARRRGRSLRLSVVDDGIGLPDTWDPVGDSGIGLANTRARLERLYGAECRFSIAPANPVGVVVQIDLPTVCDAT